MKKVKNSYDIIINVNNFKYSVIILMSLKKYVVITNIIVLILQQICTLHFK